MNGRHQQPSYDLSKKRNQCHGYVGYVESQRNVMSRRKGTAFFTHICSHLAGANGYYIIIDYIYIYIFLFLFALKLQFFRSSLVWNWMQPVANREALYNTSAKPNECTDSAVSMLPVSLREGELKCIPRSNPCRKTLLCGYKDTSREMNEMPSQLFFGFKRRSNALWVQK